MTDIAKWSENEEIKIELLQTILHYIKNKIPQCVLPEYEYTLDYRHTKHAHTATIRINNMSFYLKVAEMIFCERQEYPFASLRIEFRELGDPHIFDRITNFLTNPDQQKLGN